MYYENRFRILGVPAIYRKRVHKSRGFGIEQGKKGTFVMFHLGKRTLCLEKKNPVRGLWNW